MAIGSITHFFDASGFGGFSTMPVSIGTTYSINVASGTSVLSANIDDDDPTFSLDGDETIAAGSPVGTVGDTFAQEAVGFRITNPAGDTHTFTGFTSGGVECFLSDTAYDSFFAAAGNYDVLHSNKFATLQPNQTYGAPIAPPCFTSGSMIITARGDIMIDDILPGDMILTRDNGFQPLAWMFKRGLSTSYFNANPQDRPVMLRKGSLGVNVPDRDVMVSPGHLVLLANSQGLAGTDTEIFVPARQLVKHDRAFQVKPLNTAYIHLLFEQHQVVKVDGMWSESFQPSFASLGAMGTVRDEVFDIFPELRSHAGVDRYTAARNVAYRGAAGRVLQNMSEQYLQ